MKKIIAFVMSLTMISAFSACSNEKTADEVVTTVITTSETTVAESEDEAVSDEIIFEQKISDEVFVEKDNDLWAVDLSRKVSEWNKNVTLDMKFGEDYSNMHMNACRLGDKFVMTTEIPDMLSTKMIFDGASLYILDDATKSYYADHSGTYTDTTDAYLVGDDAADSYIESVIEEIDGVSYICEIYNIEGQVIKYYFDENGNVKKACTDVDGENLYFDFTIDFSDTIDETVFEIPDDYSEASL